ncbi:UAA transporter [Patellaria atrata CBS 101060]|uniref:UDP-galactose transporter homolog 1 n=1 Tax=Patellaria atrata CBS 101060 TaxID=1346257 RepID=A0A9P4S7X4_9PEZI|nr:UAA transporter [Patellaria atrata CBS 101060]
MARVKSPAMQREPSETFKTSNGDRTANSRNVGLGSSVATAYSSTKQAGLLQLLICVGGIYASFLTWAVLQERITTTSYGPSSKPQKFTYPVFLNTIQSAFAAISGYIYLRSSTPKGRRTPAIFPTRAILIPLTLVAVTSSLASPFGYASLSHIDYITFILAKSCKLLPVMALHITIFRKRYPLYKYGVVMLVTLGVAVFTLHHPSSSKKSKKGAEQSSAWGLLLLGINLLFDGLTNSTQDYIFGAYRPYTGPQMMCAQNIMSTLLTTSYLLLSPYISGTGLGNYLGMVTKGGELQQALDFVTTYPKVGWDVLGFAACGAVGQVFIFYALEHFSSLMLVTVTVTRKMLTMVLSVLWFGHHISGMQWLGVGLVFGGIGAEGVIQRREKMAKEKAKREAALRANGATGSKKLS